MAILTAAQLGQVVPDGNPAALLRASAMLTLLVGAALVLACLLRLGIVANFISEPVLVGFRAGIGLVIVVDQIPKILGIHFARGTFIQNVLSIVHTLPRTSLATLAVGLTIIVLLVSMERFGPKLPAPLLAVAAAITGAYFLNLQHRGVELVGHIPPGLPSLVKPDLSLITVLWPGALGIALMSFTETVASGRAFARNDEPVPRAGRELLATGLANVGGALLGAMPGGGGTTQTAVNVLAGARTQLAEMVTAAMALLTILFLAPLVAMMPQSALAALVIVYSFGLIKPIEFREILSIRRTEFSWAIVAFAGVVFVGTLKGIIVAIVVSLVTPAYHVADPPVSLTSGSILCAICAALAKKIGPSGRSSRRPGKLSSSGCSGDCGRNTLVPGLRRRTYTRTIQLHRCLTPEPHRRPARWGETAPTLRPRSDRCVARAHAKLSNSAKRRAVILNTGSFKSA